jgi:ABC-2 type transport system ATP-binding protein
MSEPIILARSLSKRYGSRLAVDRLDLAIDEGEVFGLLGPNGAGKTTTILMLLGLTEPTSGEARVAGFDPVRQPLEVKRRVGYMPDQVGFYEDLTGQENLRYAGRLMGLSGEEADVRIEAALARVRLSDVAGGLVGAYSRGMRQRLAIAEILIKRVRVAILDEPTGGLDPQSTHEFLALIRSLKHDGVTVLLSSHMLDQVQSICDRVALFNRGRIGLIGKVGDLLSEVLGGTHIIRVEARGMKLREAISCVSGVTRVTTAEDQLVVEARGDVRAQIARAVVEAGGDLKMIAAGYASLADVYAKYFAETAHAA